MSSCETETEGEALVKESSNTSSQDAGPSVANDLESAGSVPIPQVVHHTHTSQEPGTADIDDDILDDNNGYPAPNEAVPTDATKNHSPSATKDIIVPNVGSDEVHSESSLGEAISPFDPQTVSMSSEDAVIVLDQHVEPALKSGAASPSDNRQSVSKVHDTELAEEVFSDIAVAVPEEGPICATDDVAEVVLGATAAAGSPTTAVDGASAAASATATPRRSLYKVKSVKWRDSTNVPIVTQNENGPCPLIAIVNVLLLKGKASPFAGKTELSADDLVGYLGDCILQSQPKNISEGAKLNYEQNMQDAFSIFHKLQTGLDVNVKFTGVCDFEYTPECIVFDLLNIPLYHGWLVDPQANDVVQSIGKLSYNQLVEKIITNKVSTDNDLITEALIAENFLERSASQLTYYGLYEINAIMKSEELGVLFRNNHFSTIFKHKDELFQLVTDQGFLSESNVIWETLSNIEGDGLFVDSNFVTVPPKHVPITTGTVAMAPNSNLSEEEQIQHDFLVALSIQEEQKKEDEKAMVWQEYKEKELGATPGISDEELAWRLHTEEQKLLAAQQPPIDGARSGSGGACANAAVGVRQQSTESDSRREATPKKKSDCTIL